jgi:fatty acid/phospholipid biosynthesis enzyme
MAAVAAAASLRALQQQQQHAVSAASTALQRVMAQYGLNTFDNVQRPAVTHGSVQQHPAFANALHAAAEAQQRSEETAAVQRVLAGLDLS